MTDKNNTPLKVGDKIRNKAGMVATLTNINGITRLVVRSNSGRITQTMQPSEVNLALMEKVV